MTKRVFLAVFLLLFVTVFAIGIFAEESEIFYYVDYVNGDDRGNSGLTPLEPLKTLGRAYTKAKTKEGVTSAVLVIMSEHPVNSSFTEIEHPSFSVTVTSFDGKTDYRASGAKIVYGDTLRYFLGGNTTFSNINFEYITSINFVAQFNHITFGEGVSFSSKGANDRGIYVVGGWQSPDSNADTALDSHITIKSGNFAVVCGGSRHKASYSKDCTYTGTHYISINGGKIDNLFGGSLEAHTSGSLELSVSGGEIEKLSAHGGAVEDAFGSSVKHFTKTAKIILSGGKIGSFKCYGITGGATVELSGAEVGKIDAGYPSGYFEYLRLQSGGKCVLKYDSDKYPAEKISAYTGFDRVVDIKAVAEKQPVDNFIPVDGVVFVSADGRGNGESPLKATSSLENAYSRIAKTGGTIVISGKYEHRSSNKLVNDGKVTITSVYGGVDYAKENGAKILFYSNFNCGGDTEFCDITLASTKNFLGIVGNGYKLHIGKNITSIPVPHYDKYLCLVAGTAVNSRINSTSMTVDSGIWDRVRGGNSSSASNCDVDITVNGGSFHEFTLGSKNAHSGNIKAVINGGEFRRGFSVSVYEDTPAHFSGNVDVTVNGGIFYGQISVSRDNKGSASGNFNLTVNGGDLRHVDYIFGASDMDGDMKSTLDIVGTVDINEKIVGETSFTNPIRQNGADPWLFYHDGYFYYTASEGRTLSLARARNLGDLKYAEKKVIYSPASGHPWSMHQWSPEIHYYTDEQVGEGNGGWYCYIAPCSEKEYREAEQNHRMYVIKCLDGDNLLGRWGNPVTGAVNVPERVVAPDIPDWEETWAGGQSSIIINGKAYTLFIAMSKERESNKNGTNSHYQYICIAPLTNPWTIKGQPTMICKPDYDWEMVGSETGAARVVEGSTAVYGNDGSVYIIYSGSGYWTTEYQLGQLKYTGGDPMDAKNWEKKPTSIFRQNNVLTGSGHASYVTDAFGQGWICYHAYVGDPKLPSNSNTYEYGGGRLAFVEPYYADKNGVVIADGAGRPADMDMVYVTKLDPTPLAERISGFDSIDNSPSFYDVLNVIKDKVAGIRNIATEDIKEMIKRVTER